MNIQEAKKYLENNEKILLAGGASGAKVYDIAGKYVLKCVRKEELSDAGQYAAYQKEAVWYEYASGKKDGVFSGFLPEIVDISYTGEETAILMKHYQTLSREKLDSALLKKIMETIAAVHTTDIPAFLKKEPEEVKLLSKDEIISSIFGWRSVLDEHPDVFSADPLTGLAKEINHIIKWHKAEEAVLNHGDFHWDNLLVDDGGNLKICDWQGVSVGAASGDLSFFFGRLNADGICPNQNQAIAFYTQEVKRRSGKTLSPREIRRHMDAADVITSFVFWHEYLHGSDVDRVRGIYGKMVEKAKDFCAM